MSGKFRGECVQMPNSANKIIINIAKQDGAKMPFKKYENDAGYDLAVNKNVTIMPNELRIVGTGLHISRISDKNIFGMIRSRSSMFMNGLMCEGIIDNDYRGEIMLMIKNMSNNIIHLERGARVAQIIFLNYNSVKIYENEDVEITARQGGGFGSTGLL